MFIPEPLVAEGALRRDFFLVYTFRLVQDAEFVVPRSDTVRQLAGERYTARVDDVLPRIHVVLRRDEATARDFLDPIGLYFLCSHGLHLFLLLKQVSQVINRVVIA